jgi:putative ABC transport system ATP-binding protein
MLRFLAVSKQFLRRGVATRALDGVTLDLAAGEFAALVGPSGSGKSTLLHLAAGLDLPTSGQVWFDGRSTAEMSEDERTRLRRTRIGLVFQFFNLVPHLTLERNVALPLLLGGQPLGAVRDRVGELLAAIDLERRARSFPDELSGGEMQRVAIARALVTGPDLLLADEPTGNLDSAASESILALLRDTRVRSGRTTLLVTHNPLVARGADRVVHLRDGRVQGPAAQPEATAG